MRRGLPVLMPLYAKKRWVTVSAGKDAGGRISALCFYVGLNDTFVLFVFFSVINPNKEDITSITF